MRAHYQNDSVLFIGGDGLALMRMNHFLAANPDVYFDQTPFVIPVQGMLWVPRVPGARTPILTSFGCVYTQESIHMAHMSATL